MGSSIAELPIFRKKKINRNLWRDFLNFPYFRRNKKQEMYMRLTPREKEMADMFEQMSKEEQEIMIEFAKRLRTEDPKELVKEINQRLHIDDE